MKLKKWITKLSAMFLAFALCLTLLPSIANASDGDWHMVHYGVYSGMGTIFANNIPVDQDDKSAGEYTDSRMVSENKEITLYPLRAGEGYQFSRWVDQNGDTITTESTVTFTALIDHDYYYYAVFEKIGGSVENVKLQAKTIYPESPTIKCGYIKVDGNGGYYTLDTEREKGTEVTLEAVALDGYNFRYWKDTETDKTLSYDAEYKVKLDSDVNVTAVFNPIEVKEMTIQIISVEAGKWTAIDGAVATDDDGPYESGLEYTAWSGDFSYVVAKDTENYKFLYWYNPTTGKKLICYINGGYRFSITDYNDILWAVYEEKTPEESDEGETVVPGDDDEETVVPGDDDDETVVPGDDDEETVVPGDDDEETVVPGDDDEETVVPGDDDEETVVPGEDDDEETVVPGEDDDEETVVPGEDDKKEETVVPEKDGEKEESVTPADNSSKTTTTATEKTSAAKKTDTDTPKTGDSGSLALWISMLLLLGAALMTGNCVFRFRRNR